MNFVVSLKESMDEYEHLMSLVASYAKALSSMLESSNKYAVETDPAAVAQFHNHMGHVIDRLGSCAGQPDEQLVNEVVSSARGELRDYREQASRYLDRLREDLETTARALHETVRAFQHDESSAEQRLMGEVARLRSLAEVDSLEQIRAGVRESAISMMECAKQLRHEKDAVVAQLRDEIRSLQKSVDEAQRAAAIDGQTGVFKQEELQKMIRREIVAERQVGVVHVSIKNLAALTSLNPRGMIDKLLIAFCDRIRRVVPAEAAIGRWQSDAFCVLLPADLLKPVSAKLIQCCRDRYTCTGGGLTRTLPVQAEVTSVHSQSRESADLFFRKIDKLHLPPPNAPADKGAVPPHAPALVAEPG